MSHQWDYSLLDFPSFPWQHTWKTNSTFDCKAPFHPGTAWAICLELWHHGWRLVFHCGRTDLAPIFARVGCSWALRFCWFLWKPTGSRAMFVWRTDWLCIPVMIRTKPVCNLMHGLFWSFYAILTLTGNKEEKGQRQWWFAKQTYNHFQRKVTYFWHLRDLIDQLQILFWIKFSDVQPSIIKVILKYFFPNEVLKDPNCSMLC